MPPKPGENNQENLNNLEDNLNNAVILDDDEEIADPNQINLEGENIENNNILPPDDDYFLQQNEEEAAVGEEEAGAGEREAAAGEGEAEAEAENLNIEAEQARNQQFDNAPEGSYLQMVGRLRQEPCKDSVVANMIAATILMQREPTAKANRNQTTVLAQKLVGQPCFNRLMQDPKTKTMLKKGNGVGLIELMAVKESERKLEIDKYKRPVEFVAQDGLVLRTAIEKIREQEQEQDAAVGAGAAGLDQKGKRYQEMMKQLEHAEALAEQGIQMSGEDCKKLIDAVKKYNDSGTKIPGGPKKAKANVEAMCLLKRFMPEEEFQAYLGGINARLKKPVQSEAFSEKRLMGQEQKASELQKKCRLQLQQHFTIENCAALVASKLTPAKNGFVDKEEYERQKAILMTNGSAFRKALQDNDVKKNVSDIVKNGATVTRIVNVVNQGAADHAGKTAQWQFNRSKAFLLGGRVNAHLAGEHLANLMALHNFVSSTGMGDKLTNKGFAERAEEVEKDPVFRRMADRYASDQQYRNYLNNKLKEDGTGACLQQEYNKVQRSMQKPGRQAAQEQQQAGI